ncbi:hypothetical protein DICVIV_08704 [Dictyocaulus viviparus]|uniref:Glycosyltransferase family 92 protein n=1 Tax=Dictyocaulus viviparus TaxID=29172 RepID=A0A0D8XL53_DICVI|nr:hypothetical protein DICVIV_08704 [Dictyocaulus viviparus]
MASNVLNITSAHFSGLPIIRKKSYQDFLCVVKNLHFLYVKRWQVLCEMEDVFYKRRLFCRIFDEQMHELLPAFQSLVFPEFTVRCPAKDHARFVALSLNPDEKITIEDMHLVEKPGKGSKTFFSVCLAPLWGSSPKWLLIIEFIEYYRLQSRAQNTSMFTSTIVIIAVRKYCKAT